MSQMAQFPRKTQLGNLYILYLIFSPFLTYVTNKCKMYVTICCKKLQHSRANKQGNLGRYFTTKIVRQNMSFIVWSSVQYG